MLTATVIFSIGIAAAYRDREWVVERLNDILRLLNLPDFRAYSPSTPWTYTLLNFLILGGF
jgi:uncharacterized protein YlxP (DUF503 family)